MWISLEGLLTFPNRRLHTKWLTFTIENIPSGCGKLKVNHNCPVLPSDDRICDIEWMNHPLKYIRAKQRSNSMRRKVEQKTISDTGDGESHND